MYYQVKLSNGKTFIATQHSTCLGRDNAKVNHLSFYVPLSLGYERVRKCFDGDITSVEVSKYEEDTSPSEYVTAPKLIDSKMYNNFGTDISIDPDASSGNYIIRIFRISDNLITAKQQAADIAASLEMLQSIKELNSQEGIK